MYGKRTVLLLLTLLFTFSVIGKKKEEQSQVVKMSTLFKQANLAIKNNANQPAAEKALLDALNRTDITNKDRARIYFYAARLQENVNGLVNR